MKRMYCGAVLRFNERGWVHAEGGGSTILARRQKIKHTTIRLRRRLHHQAVA